MAKAGQYKKNAKPASVAKRAYNQQPEQKKRRAGRNAARREMVAAGKAHKGDGRDVDHKNFNTLDNKRSNLHMMSKSANRAKNRGTGGRPKGK